MDGASYRATGYSGNMWAGYNIRIILLVCEVTNICLLTRVISKIKFVDIDHIRSKNQKERRG